MQMQSTAQHSFAATPKISIPRSSFNRSSGHKTMFDGGDLVPIFLDEILPGDTFNLKTTHFIRLATPIFPIMDNIYIETFYFYVPNRLIWDNWEKMMGAQDDPADSISFTVPSLSTGTSENWLTFSLGHRLGLPPHTTSNSTEVSQLPFRCYNFI